MGIETEEDARFVAEKIRDGTLTGERKEQAFQMLEDYRSSNPVPEERSFIDNVGRGVGLTARNVAKAPGQLADFGAKVLNLPIEGLDKAGQFLGDEPLTTRLPTDSAATIDRIMTEFGLPTEETGLERIGSDIQTAGIFAATPIKAGTSLQGAANPVTRGVGETLAANPTLQGVSAVTGSGASSTVRESGGTEGQQLAAGLVGGLSPSAVAAGGPALVRRTVAGSGDVLRENVDTFARAGTTPTVAQGTQGRIAQATESLLSRSPGGAGQIAGRAQSQTDDVARRVEQIADDLAPKATAERAGRAIETGVSGFVDRFKQNATRLYDAVDDHVDVNGPVRITSTKSFLDDAATPVQGAEQTSQLLSSNFLDDVRNALDTDISNALANGVEGLPYSALKSLRSRVGEKINNLSLIDDASKAELKRLYGALSEDLTAYAQSQGGGQAAARADSFYRAGISRIENIERIVNKSGGPEKIFNAAVAGTKEGATVLRTVMKSLKPEEQKMVAAAMVRRMGKATPGVQDASGEAFSVNTYLTNWAKLSPEARGTLFGRFGAKFQKDMDALADFAANIRQGSDVFRNPSGTQQAVSLQTVGTGTVLSAAIGQFEIAAALAGTSVGANLVSRLMTNPRFVNWLAVQSKVPAGAYAAQVNSLARIANETNDRDIALMVGVLQEQQNQTTDEDNGR